MKFEAIRIDVHHHILPKIYLDSLAKIGIIEAAGIPFPKWSPEESIKMMERFSIRKAIVSISSPGVYFGDIDFSIKLARSCNNYCSELKESYPNSFGAFATLPIPDKEASITELRYSLDTLKLEGVSLLSNYQGIYLGDVLFEGIYSELNQRNAIVFIHPNAPYGENSQHNKTRAAALEFVFDTTRTVASMLSQGIIKKYPNIKFILSHAGGTVPYVAWRLAFGNQKIIDFIKSYYYDIALSATPYVFASMKELIDPTHILFGSDFPFLPAPLIDKLIKNLEEYIGFNAETKNLIDKENAISIFNI